MAAPAGTPPPTPTTALPVPQLGPLTPTQPAPDKDSNGGGDEDDDEWDALTECLSAIDRVADQLAKAPAKAPAKTPAKTPAVGTTALDTELTSALDSLDTMVASLAAHSSDAVEGKGKDSGGRSDPLAPFVTAGEAAEAEAKAKAEEEEEKKKEEGEEGEEEEEGSSNSSAGMPRSESQDLGDRTVEALVDDGGAKPKRWTTQLLGRAGHQKNRSLLHVPAKGRHATVQYGASASASTSVSALVSPGEQRRVGASASAGAGTPGTPPSPSPRPRGFAELLAAMASSTLDARDVYAEAARPWTPAPIAADASPEERQRLSVANEIVATEIDFVKDVAFLTVAYAQPLRHSPHGLSQAEYLALFNNLDPILIISLELLQKLQAAGDTGVGATFLALADFLKCYTSFCSSQQARIDTLRAAVKRSSDFRRFIADVKQRPESRHLDLDSFLMRPVQRICKYPLLLRELRKVTRDPRQAADLDAAIAKIQRVVDMINTSTRSIENQKLIRDLRPRLANYADYLDTHGDLMVPARQLLREAPVADLLRTTGPDVIAPYRDLVAAAAAAGTSTGTSKNTELILFNDAALLVAAHGKKKLKILEWLTLGDILLDTDCEPAAPASTTPSPAPGDAPREPSPARSPSPLLASGEGRSSSSFLMSSMSSSASSPSLSSSFSFSSSSSSSSSSSPAAGSCFALLRPADSAVFVLGDPAGTAGGAWLSALAAVVPARSSFEGAECFECDPERIAEREVSMAVGDCFVTYSFVDRTRFDLVILTKRSLAKHPVLRSGGGFVCPDTPFLRDSQQRPIVYRTRLFSTLLCLLLHKRPLTTSVAGNPQWTTWSRQSRQACSPRRWTWRRRRRSTSWAPS